MKRDGFTLIELLVVIAILVILAGVAIKLYLKYRDSAIRASLVSDLRNCITFIWGEKELNSTAKTSQLVKKCRKSRYTQDIILESEDPLKLKATSIKGDIYCTYNEPSGSVKCTNVFK